MLHLLLGIYVFHCIRKLLSGNTSWHCLSCGDDEGGGTSDEEKYNQAVAPAKDYQADMMKLFKEAYMPYMQDISGLWSQYGKGIQEGQLKTYQDIGLPAYRTMGEKLTADVNDPWIDTKPVFDKIWQQTREKTAAEYAPIEQRTSQRLAGAGALDTGAALKTGTDIEQSKYKSLETQAIDQALQEFNIQNAAKQQSYENMFRYLNYQPSVNTSAITSANYSPEIIPPYTAPAEQPFDWGGMLSGIGSIFGGMQGMFGSNSGSDPYGGEWSITG